MRILVLFDLPAETKQDRREYARFRKELLKNGFLMLQESVYCRLALNRTTAAGIMAFVRQIKPRRGLVQMLMITEKQFSQMEIVQGELVREMVDTDERLVIL